MSARIEDVLAEQLTAEYGDEEWHELGSTRRIRQALERAGFGDVAQARRDAFLEAAEAMDDLPGCTATGYYSSYEEAGYREAARHAERLLLTKHAEDSPAPSNRGDGGARPASQRPPDSPGVDLPATDPAECEDCGETVRHSACSHGKDLCPGCRPGLCHGCQADSAELCGDATKAGDVPC